MAGLLCAPALADEPAGVWLNAASDLRVRIGPCGPALCGTIVWDGGDRRDLYNPDPALRGRSLVGIRIITDLRRSGPAWSGALYNHLDGRAYEGEFRLKDRNTVELVGCTRGGGTCRSAIWTRVE
jgi:uncharacterized protein (DUF2147 family)